MQNKKILEVSLSNALGGLELFMVRCYENFNSELIVDRGTKLDDYIDADKTYIKRNKFFPIFPALKLAKYIDKNSIDFVHFHWTKDMPTVVLAKLFSKTKPKIMQTRNMNMTRFKSDFYHRFLYKNIDIIHAVTYKVKEQLERFVPHDVRPKIEVVYMGTKEKSIDEKICKDLREKYDLKDSFIVGIVGRIEDAKGQWILVEALFKLKDLDIKLLIVGQTMDENYLQSLKEKIENLGLSKRVIFTGFTREVNEHIKLCDVTVLATPKETFGLVIIESMMTGVPVIATNNGGPLEIIEDGVDGLLFDRSVDDLASKLELLYHDRGLKDKLSENAYKKAKESFEEKKQLEKLKEVINNS
jgi:glycosyltransferase involved in cell wall biosynthesis